MMKLQSWKTSLHVFSWLLWSDVRLIWKDFFQNLLDAMVWPITIILINGYVMPSLGLPLNYGAFTAVSMVVIMGAYNAWAGSIAIAADLAGPKTITYDLTLPLPYWMVWIKNGLYLAMRTAAFNSMPLLIGKIILGSQFDLSNFSVIKFSIIYAFSCLFFGMFALWSTVITKTAESHSRLEIRLIGPMFFLNGWAASWATLYVVSPALAIAIRCLPWIYAYEGCRAAVLGQKDYLNLWLCVGMIVIFTVLIMYSSIRLFKKRMNCI
jgi:hypothetical protein